jgi:hypothetical protein
MFNPTIIMTVRAEHELRVRKAQRAWEAAAWEAEAALRPGRGRTERAALRRRAGDALVVLGQRIGGTTPPPATGKLGRVAG